jgi:hypothetical protein
MFLHLQLVRNAKHVLHPITVWIDHVLSPISEEMYETSLILLQWGLLDAILGRWGAQVPDASALGSAYTEHNDAYHVIHMNIRDGQHEPSFPRASYH